VTFSKYLLAPILLLSFSAFAQTGVESETLKKDAPTIESDALSDDAPPQEFPYPNAKSEEQISTAPTEEPKPKVNLVQKSAAPRPQAVLKIDPPKVIDEEGTYLYETSKETDERKVEDMKIPQAGPEPQQGALHLTPPLEIKANGDYFYGYEKSTHDSAASLKLGYFAPPRIQNPVSQFSFSDLYTGNPIPTFFFDYEFQFNGRFGALGLRAGTGLFYSTGTGRFVHRTDPERDPSARPDISFNFVMLPNTLTALYHFQYWEKQLFTPYVGGGAGYFVFGEIRDDGGSPKLGAAPVGVVLGGLNILADGIDPIASRELESEYGISHVSINLEFSQIIGLNPSYDFSSSVISAGVNMEF
jgi:hypothetical protein